MEMQFKMPFEMKRLMWDTELGSVGDIDWNGLLSHNYNGKGELTITRSRGDGQVKFDLELHDEEEGIDVFTRSGFLLSDVVERKFYLPRSVFRNNEVKGYLIVHYNLNNFLPSKKEAVTQTDHSISSFIENIPSPHLVDDLLHLLDSPDSFSDATLVCGDTKISAHRSILSARSPVFAAMFKTQMQEGREGVVDIVDMELDVLQAMLRYVYSGKTDHLTPSMAGDLLFGADKYQLEELKSRCVEELKTSMAANNVFRSLVLGDLHDKSLKACAVEFICKCTKFSDLEKSEEWQSLLKEHSHLAVEVLTTVVKYLQK